MANLETATLGGGCFWCTEAVFDDLKGVTDVVSGYMGGHVVNPTYEEVCGKKTGHVEVIQVTFDPAEISYADLLRVYFATHDPTTPDQQGNDIGPQYASVIFTHSQSQADTAWEVMRLLREDQVFDAPIVTEVRPAETFYPAEGYHQEYFARNPAQPYCQFVVAPKVGKFRKQFLDKLKR